MLGKKKTVLDKKIPHSSRSIPTPFLKGQHVLSVCKINTSCPKTCLIHFFRPVNSYCMSLLYINKIRSHTLPKDKRIRKEERDYGFPKRKLC